MATNVSIWRSEYSGKQFSSEEEANAHDERVLDVMVAWLRENMEAGWLNEGQLREIAGRFAGKMTELRKLMSKVD
jgi:hypothetical protein